MICANTRLEGSVQIGADSILHPTCMIFAKEGTSIVIGERNIIEERCKVRDTSLGHGNLIEVAAEITNSTVLQYILNLVKLY